jgi:hypothetical protein
VNGHHHFRPPGFPHRRNIRGAEKQIEPVPSTSQRQIKMFPKMMEDFCACRRARDFKLVAGAGFGQSPRDFRDVSLYAARLFVGESSAIYQDAGH